MSTNVAVGQVEKRVSEAERGSSANYSFSPKALKDCHTPGDRRTHTFLCPDMAAVSWSGERMLHFVTD